VPGFISKTGCLCVLFFVSDIFLVYVALQATGWRVSVSVGGGCVEYYRFCNTGRTNVRTMAHKINFIIAALIYSDASLMY
jgi:hypothetical protein